MVIHIGKKFCLTLAAIFLVFLGAIGTWAGTKFMEPSSNVNKDTPTIQTSMVAKDSIPHVAVPTIDNTVQEVKVPEAATVPVPAAETPKVVAQPALISSPTPTPSLEAAQPIPPGYILASIVRVKPHYVQTSMPYRSCHMEPRTILVSGGGPSGAGVAIGGVTGGLLGHEIGGGSGKVAATIGGTILGAVVGNQVESEMSRPQPRTVFVRVCQVEYAHKSVHKGYEVTYHYQNKNHTMITKHAPTEETILVPVARL